METSDTRALMLLEQARTKIESGLITRFFTGPVLVFFEIITYLLIPVISWAGLVFWTAVAANMENAKENTVAIRLSRDPSLSESADVVTALLFFFILLLPITMFLLARLITANRRRLAKLRDVELLIEDAMGELGEKGMQV